MFMSILFGMAFLQLEPEKEPSPEMFEAFECLSDQIKLKLSEHNQLNEHRVIWGYANDITDRCSKEIKRASEKEEPLLFKLGNAHNTRMTREQALRAEARYFAFNTILKALEKKENPLGFADE